jgi:hypothetical protein
VCSNALYNDSLGSNGEASFEVNQAEHTEVDRLEVVNDFQKRTMQIMISLEIMNWSICK